MKEIKEAIKNNKNEKQYIENKRFLKFYDCSSNNKVEISNSLSPKNLIHELETKERYNNLKVFKQHIKFLRRKKVILFGIPALLGTLTLATMFNTNTSTKIVDTYKKEVIEFDEEHLRKYEVDDKTYTNYAFPKRYVDENVDNVLSLNGSAEMYFGKNEDTLCLRYSIYKDGRWNYVSQQNISHIVIPMEEETEYTPVDEKYLKLLKDIIAMYDNSTVLPDDRVINSLNNEENDCLVKLERYTSNGQMEVEYYKIPLSSIFVIIMSDILYFLFIRRNREKLLYANRLFTNRGHLYLSSDKEINRDNRLNLKYAKLEYEQEFLNAESERILLIEKYLSDYGADQAILTDYEKELCKRLKG